MRGLLAVTVVLGLLLMQSVGVIAVHDHLPGTAAHVHQYHGHGDDHFGHAEDVVPSDAEHPEAADATAQRARVLVAMVGLAIVAAVLSAFADPRLSPRRGRPPVRARSSRGRLALLTVLRL